MASRSMVGKKVKVSWWIRLSARERRMLMILGGVFLFVFAMAITYLRLQRTGAYKEEIAAYQRALSLVFTEGANYKSKLAATERREATISSTPLSFASLIEQAENAAAVQATDQEEEPPSDLEGGLRKRTIKFEMRDITLEQMTGFLEKVETKPGHVVLAEYLAVRALRANTTEPEDRLSVDYELATWERTADAGDGEEEE